MRTGALVGAFLALSLVSCGGGSGGRSDEGGSRAPAGGGGRPKPTPTGTPVSTECATPPSRRDVARVAERLPVARGAAEPAAVALLAFTGAIPVACVKK